MIDWSCIEKQKLAKIRTNEEKYSKRGSMLLY